MSKYPTTGNVGAERIWLKVEAITVRHDRELTAAGAYGGYVYRTPCQEAEMRAALILIFPFSWVQDPSSRDGVTIVSQVESSCSV